MWTPAPRTRARTTPNLTSRFNRASRLFRGRGLAHRHTRGPTRGNAGHSQLLADLGLDLVGQIRVVAQEVLGVVAPLAETQIAVGVPGAALDDEFVLDAEVDELAVLRDPLAVVDVELGLAEGGGHLVLGHLHLHPRAGHLLAVLDGGDAPDVDAHRGVELEGPAAGRGLRAAEHDADLFADLVDEDQGG